MKRGIRENEKRNVLLFSSPHLTRNRFNGTHKDVGDDGDPQEQVHEDGEVHDRLHRVNGQQQGDIWSQQVVIIAVLLFHGRRVCMHQSPHFRQR